MEDRYLQGVNLNCLQPTVCNKQFNPNEVHSKTMCHIQTRVKNHLAVRISRKREMSIYKQIFKRGVIITRHHFTLVRL